MFQVCQEEEILRIDYRYLSINRLFLNAKPELLYIELIKKVLSFSLWEEPGIALALCDFGGAPKEFIEKGFAEEKRFLFKVKRLDCLFDWRGENPLLLGLAKELQKENFDIYQSTDYYRFITFDTLKAARQKKKPFIML